MNHVVITQFDHYAFLASGLLHLGQRVEHKPGFEAMGIPVFVPVTTLLQISRITDWPCLVSCSFCLFVLRWSQPQLKENCEIFLNSKCESMIGEHCDLCCFVFEPRLMRAAHLEQLSCLALCYCELHAAGTDTLNTLMWQIKGHYRPDECLTTDLWWVIKHLYEQFWSAHTLLTNYKMFDKLFYKE